MNENLVEIFKRMFKLEEVKADASPDNLEAWDSYAHIELILEVEASFGISISTSDAVELTSFKKIEDYLASHGAC